MSNYQNILEQGHAPVMTKEYKPKLPRTFDKYLTPDELKTVVFNNPRIQLLLESMASNSKQTRKEVDKKAKEILNEIGLARNLAMIRWAGMCITTIGRRILSGVYVNEANIIRVRDKMGNLPILYLPSHRSYCDFILMSYICFKYDIEIPGIAAGMDFYSMVGMGSFLRKTGAFYMRRSFSGDDLYWEIFREYMHALVIDYHIGIEFFIEGTRSRNFKALVPKVGLLSMALEPLFMGQVPDIMVVPVSVSYDKVLEEQLFVTELLGVPKPKESTKGFLRALKKLDQKFGRMYVDFGEPISAKNFFGSNLDRIRHSNVAPYLQKLSKNEIALIKELGFEVVQKQQERIVITTFNLIAYFYSYNVFLNTRLSLEQLCNGVLILKNIFDRLGAHVAAKEKSINMDVIESIEIHSNILHFPTAGSNLELVRPTIQLNDVNLKTLKGHYLNAHAMQLAVSTVSLQIYINPCMFWVSGPALMILAALKLSNETSGKAFQKDELRLRIIELNEIFAVEFVIIKSREELEFIRNLETLSQLRVMQISDKILFTRNETADILLSSLVPFLCCYFQVIETILEKCADQDFNEKDLLVAVQQRIEAALTARPKYIHPYCLSLDNIKSALASFTQNSFVQQEKKANATKYRCHQTKLLSLRNNFLQYLQLLPFTINEYCYIISKL